ncbi:hypothetical protein ASG25_10845 [Rhizobium sp. Leaf384]|uniref:hypothetical protein n=1 Tax=Rhizobium sp. Leaf384 TaxID=1736358 RepID=UPI0007148E94|nr:hypothetical protein [Rhizobium sp. Leaf384]KQS79075.1 hypothetical protein ASG25_10845 [Rhizobium sp. Leaf384]
MNEIVNTERLLPPGMGTIAAGSSVRAIVPANIEDAFRIAKMVTIAGMAPAGFDTAEKCMVAIMHGMEVGMTPMAALQSIAVVNNRPTIWGDGAIGLVRGSGKCEWIKERIEGDGDARVAICEAKRRGEPEPVVGRFSVKDAMTAGLWTKSGPWKLYPERMLKMRARAFTLRDAFADVLRGLGIAEEVQDFQPMQDITPRAAARPPAPPKPPAPPAGKTIDAEEPPVEPGFDLGEFMETLELALAGAKSEADVEEAWNDADAPAVLETEGHADMINAAYSMRDRRLSQISPQNAG